MIDEGRKSTGIRRCHLSSHWNVHSAAVGAIKVPCMTASFRPEADIHDDQTKLDGVGFGLCRSSDGCRPIAWPGAFDRQLHGPRRIMGLRS